ncbi:MAG: transporter [Methylotenera sp.]|uniref:OmpP1/FadL family transporter n=1 Tax=Methylotenera sp. TaxID=2051956 RepID=UPI0017FF40DA|nr:outer membrane protein transport protein [Methylotenera sp.]NOU24488.1 transporter [Methylotenera sp.]
MKKLLLSFAMLSSPIASQAAGFALIEQSASGMGNAFAGGAAAAEDASTIFFNPAGMTYIQGTQIVGAIHLIKPNAEFNDQGSIPANINFAQTAFRPIGSEGPNAGDLAFVPNFYYKRDLTDTIKFGLGLNAPFGLKTEYDDKWIGRFQADKSEVKTININPSIAFKLNDQLSLGLGVSVMRAEATLTRAVNFGPFGEGSVKVKGDDWGFGVNLGAIYQVTADTRIGVAYRSKVEQHLDGNVKFSRPIGLPGPLVAATPNGGVKADLTLPENFSVSAFSHVNDKWDLMGDVTWTRWSQFKELAVYRDGGKLLTNTIENWENTLRYSIGASYQYNDTLKLRAGLAFDEEAINDKFRTARIPGNDRKWLSLGVSYQLTPASKFDLGYSHLFINDAKVDDNQTAVSPTAPFNSGRLRGSFDGSVDILSAQYTHNF